MFYLITIYGGVMITEMREYDCLTEAMQEFQECSERDAAGYDYYVWKSHTNEQMAAHIHGAV